MNIDKIDKSMTFIFDKIDKAVEAGKKNARQASLDWDLREAKSVLENAIRTLDGGNTAADPELVMELLDRARALADRVVGLAEYEREGDDHGRR